MASFIYQKLNSKSQIALDVSKDVNKEAIKLKQTFFFFTVVFRRAIHNTYFARYCSLTINGIRGVS